MAKLGFGNILSMEQLEQIYKHHLPEWENVDSFVEGLSDDEKRQICAIMLLGREDFDSYQESLKYCLSFPIETTADYILGKTQLLEDHLRQGMKKMVSSTKAQF